MRGLHVGKWAMMAGALGLGMAMAGGGLWASPAADLAPRAPSAATLPAARPTRIMVVDVEKVFNRLHEKKDADAAFTKKFQPRLEEVTAMNTDNATLKSQIDKLPAGEDRQKQQAELDLRVAKAQGITRKLTSDVEIDQMDRTAKLYERIVAATEALRVEGGYDLILADAPVSKSSARSVQNLLLEIRTHVVLARDPRTDLTAALIHYMDGEYEKGRGADAK